LRGALSAPITRLQPRRFSLPVILFDARVGLRDWADPKTAVERLASLADALVDLSTAERRDLRDQLRRAWTDIADARLSLPGSLVLVVERLAGLELLHPDGKAKPVVRVTSERQGFAARALADRGEAVLDVGENDAATIRDLLEQSESFSARLVDTGDVQLLVDGATFEPNGMDPILVTGGLEWLADAFVLAHEHLGDPLELRTLPSDELERRLRNIRMRRCGKLIYAGRVGTGMSVKVLADLRRCLEPLASKTSPLTVLPSRKTRFGSPLVLSRVHWVEPELVAEITYLTWTADGLLRHTVYVGLREDKPAADVRREAARG
jgi:hypothetical protein